MNILVIFIVVVSAFLLLPLVLSIVLDFLGIIDGADDDTNEEDDEE